MSSDVVVLQVTAALAIGVAVALVILNQFALARLRGFTRAFHELRDSGDALGRQIDEMRGRVAEQEKALARAYGILLSVAQGPVPPEVKIQLCRDFLEAEGVSGTIHMVVESDDPSAHGVH